MVQYYGVFDIAALPYDKAAILVRGLPDDSRLKRKIAGAKVPLETLLLAHCADLLATLCWFKTKDAKHKKNRPASILDKLLGEEKQDKVKKFNSPAAFEAAYNLITGGG